MKRKTDPQKEKKRPAKAEDAEKAEAAEENQDIEEEKLSLRHISVADALLEERCTAMAHYLD